MPLATLPFTGTTISQNTLLHEGDQGLLWTPGSAVKTGDTSMIFELARRPGPAYPFGASFQFKFSASPGVFQLDVQTSDTGDPNDFVSISSLTGGLNSSFVGRIELPNFWARYVRVSAVTITNNVTMTHSLVTR